jgi:lysozyme family protein
MNTGKDCVVFDFDVNSGDRAIKIAQQIVGTDQDGDLGPITFAAIQAYDPTQFIDDMCNERLKFLKSLSVWDEFGFGWTARVADLRVYCKNLLLPSGVATEMGATFPIKLGRGKGYDQETINQLGK